MASCTIFKNFTIPVENKSLLLIGKDIISDKYKTEVEEIRNLIAQGKREAANEKKKSLLAFTPSAVFSEKRQMPFLEMYSGFVHLDFDKLTQEQLQTAFAIISKISYTSLCFISPSGNGLKVFVEVSTGLEHHDIAYLQVQKHYEDATGLKADTSCKDVTRLCFMSHDPNAYRNIQNEKFVVALPQFIQEQQTQTPTANAPNVPVETAELEDLNSTFLFNQQIQFTNQKLIYTDGNRNNYIYLLASNCNRAGLQQSDTELLCKQHFDLSEREIKAAVNSAY
ncbi:MAG: BT4734/BF3469 family protein, partial [Bacteroidota bacterium]|nr:BT4734/BF3469 family protein [Bacteroidota bacterium]